MLRRMARCSDHAREQMELAAATAVQPVFLSGACRMAVGQMLARTFAGSGFDPARLNPERIAAVFVAVSAECLAAFVTKRPDPAADKLEAGVTVFADSLAEAPWRLSPRQFARFIAGAARHTANLENLNGRFGDRWPAPAAWRSADAPVRRRRHYPAAEQESAAGGRRGDGQLSRQGQPVRAAGSTRAAGAVLHSGRGRSRDARDQDPGTARSNQVLRYRPTEGAEKLAAAAGRPDRLRGLSSGVSTRA